MDRERRGPGLSKSIVGNARRKRSPSSRMARPTGVSCSGQSEDAETGRNHLLEKINPMRYGSCGTVADLAAQ
jgi:hypothetical protein